MEGSVLPHPCPAAPRCLIPPLPQLFPSPGPAPARSNEPGRQRGARGQLSTGPQPVPFPKCLQERLCKETGNFHQREFFLKKKKTTRVNSAKGKIKEAGCGGCGGCGKGLILQLKLS